ncbi:mfs monocarboxylate [Lichtheimia corymbifera JMRC:FSU:9682]|uniref:Mfs monocarboxylate n=1 Tax=Lichtheimia corymbifera JMRC:FSU:9682 TaxID=1263082 RepID=A0A068RMM0_9FUNG|nr:mfs monocarboxylate [Lichtheimia corymbifera JMRC:FSU:9682]
MDKSNPTDVENQNKDTVKHVEDGSQSATEADIKEKYVEGQQQKEPYEGWRNPGWRTVFGSFLVSFYLWGVTYGWGVFEVLYLDIYPEVSKFSMSFVGPLVISMTCWMGPLSLGFIQRVQSYRLAYFASAIICPLSLVLASFATQFWQIALCQGIAFGAGGGCAYLASCLLPAQWFVRNRGLASSIAVAGGSVGPVVICPIIQAMIDSSLGYRNALRVLAVMGFVMLGLSAILTQSPTPVKRNPDWWKIVDRQAFFNMKYAFWILGIIFITFGYFAACLLIPLYSKSIGASPSLGSGLVSVNFAVNCVSRILLGYLADRLGAINVLLLTSLLTGTRKFMSDANTHRSYKVINGGDEICVGVFVMVVWQFSQTVPVYVVFCVLFGATGGTFLGLMPSCIARIAGMPMIVKGLCLSYIIGTIGILFGDPIAGALLSQYSWTAAIQFLGAVYIASSIVTLLSRRLIVDKLITKV